jgi:hypothetical protein
MFTKKKKTQAKRTDYGGIESAMSIEKKKRDETNFVKTDMRSKKNKKEMIRHFFALPRSHTGSISTEKEGQN